jgi:hypothetical protein
VPNIRLALGPDNASFWVTDARDYRWWNLPSGLNTQVEKLRGKNGHFTDAPRLVALGAKGSYFMVTSKNAASWCVADEYPELGKWIDQAKAANGNKGGTFSSVTVRYYKQKLPFERTSGLY